MFGLIDRTIQQLAASWFTTDSAIFVSASSVASSSLSVFSNNAAAFVSPSSFAHLRNVPYLDIRVMFDSLRCGQHCGIERWRALVHDLSALVGDADDGVTRLRLGLFVEHGEHLFQTIDVALRFAVVFCESGLEHTAVGSLR
jgi:hypothetical protein